SAVVKSTVASSGDNAVGRRPLSTLTLLTLVPTRGSAMTETFNSGGATTRPPGRTSDDTSGPAIRTLSSTSGRAFMAGNRAATGRSPLAPPVMASAGWDQATNRSKTVEVRRAPAGANTEAPPGMAGTT